MAKLPGPVGTILGVAKVAKSAYKAAKRVQANKTNKPTDPYGAPMRMVDKRTVDKYKELTPADYKRFADESLKRTLRQPRTEPRLEPRTEPRAIEEVLYKKPKN